MRDCSVALPGESKRKRTHEVAESLKQQGVNVDQMEAEVLAAMKERRRVSVDERYFYL